MKILCSFFALIMMMESCNSTKETVVISPENIEKLSGTYFISQIEGYSTISEELSITFEDATNKVTGFAGCNTFFGTYNLDNQSITFQAIAMTKKYCQMEVNNLENQFLKALKSANKVSINENIMSLLVNDTVLLTANKRRALKGKSNSKIIYQVLSRGAFEYVEISESGVIVSSDRNLINSNNYKCYKEDWEVINSLINDLNLDAFEDLESPTGKRLFDGAPHATLVIKQGDRDFKTPSFDGGFPPEAIEALVNKVISIKENAVKQ
jgi:heat shock protein HslJ